MKTSPRPTQVIRSIARSVLLVAVPILLASCGGSSDPESGESASTGTDTPPELAAVFLDNEPEGARPVLEIRKSAQPGDEVIMKGKIGGVMSPFTSGFANFVLADTSLQTCDLTDDDKCPTPWDACCIEPAEVKATLASVQVLGDDERPIAIGLEGVEGLSELDELVVTGSVAPGSTSENLIVNATGIFLAKHWVAPKAGD